MKPSDSAAKRGWNALKICETKRVANTRRVPYPAQKLFLTLLESVTNCREHIMEIQKECHG
ncbi:MAG: hypothetical protein M3Q81_01445 [bacterium]|nr:hypothetical protein [bacterium]